MFALAPNDRRRTATDSGVFHKVLNLEAFPSIMNRRRFAFWLGFGLFSLAERVHANSLDRLAAAILRSVEKDGAPAALDTPEHWIVANDKVSWWYERENWIDNRWISTGMTPPIHKETGEVVVGSGSYIEVSCVPKELLQPQLAAGLEQGEASFDASEAHADPARRARHGRPPSAWLRSLRADELRIWLKTLDVPEAGVSGMTFWTHLTRDHSFDPDRIKGLNDDELAKLHAAAHYGY